MKKLIFTFMSVLLLFGLNFTFASSTLAETTYDQEELDYARQIRKDFGLDKSDKKIIQLLKDKNNTKTKKYMGTYLDESEQIKLEKRLEKVSEITPKIKERLIKKFGKEKFGGLSIRHDEGGKIYVGLKSEFADHDLSELVNDHKYKDIKLIPVKYSEDELKSATSYLTEHIGTLADKGVQINSISTDLQQNLLQIGVGNINSSTISILQSYTNVPFELEKSEPAIETIARDSRLRPIQSGLQINPTGGPSDQWCTTGFTGYDNTSAGTLYYTLTAAHCGGKGSDWSQGGSFIGSIERRSYDTPAVDAAAIRISATNKTHYVYGTGSNSYEITGWQKVSQQNQYGSVTFEDSNGDDVCFAGATTNKQVCGYIVDTNATVKYTNGNVRHGMRVASMGAKGGDSGAGVYQRGKAMGILQGTTGTGKMVYTYMGYVVNNLDLDGVLVK